MVYPVWMEGFVATGGQSKANYLGEFEANSFADACRIACKTKLKDVTLFDIRNGIPCYWGCCMYDNEVDARENFG